MNRLANSEWRMANGEYRQSHSVMPAARFGKFVPAWLHGLLPFHSPFAIRHSPFRAQRGFTFVEVLAAMVFVAIALPVALQGVMIAVRASEAAERRRAASELASMKLSELVVTGDWAGTETEGDFGEERPGFTWSLETGDWQQDGVTLLTLTVTYPVQGREMHFPLSALAEDAQ